LCVTVAAPLIVPTAVGVKVTVNVHMPFAPTVAPHGAVPPGTAAKSPLPAILVMFKVEL